MKTCKARDDAESKQLQAKLKRDKNPVIKELIDKEELMKQQIEEIDVKKNECLEKLNKQNIENIK